MPQDDDYTRACLFCQTKQTPDGDSSRVRLCLILFETGVEVFKLHA